MSTQITCPACQKSFAFRPELVGKQVKCPCGHSFRVQAPTASQPPTLSQTVTPPTAQPAEQTPRAAVSRPAASTASESEVAESWRDYALKAGGGFFVLGAASYVLPLFGLQIRKLARMGIEGPEFSACMALSGLVLLGASQMRKPALFLSTSVLGAALFFGAFALAFMGSTQPSGQQLAQRESVRQDGTRQQQMRSTADPQQPPHGNSRAGSTRNERPDQPQSGERFADRDMADPTADDPTRLSMEEHKQRTAERMRQQQEEAKQREEERERRRREREQESKLRREKIEREMEQQRREMEEESRRLRERSERDREMRRREIEQDQTDRERSREIEKRTEVRRRSLERRREDQLLVNLKPGEKAGGDGGGDYILVDQQLRPVVGFHFYQRSFGDRVLGDLVPVYDQDDPLGESDEVVMAKRGYVVAGLVVDAERHVNAVKVVFAKRRGRRLNVRDSYESPWLGTPSGSQPPIKLQSDRALVVGTYGGRGLVLDSVGLVVVGR